MDSVFFWGHPMEIKNVKSKVEKNKKKHMSASKIGIPQNGWFIVEKPY